MWPRKKQKKKKVPTSRFNDGVTKLHLTERELAEAVAHYVSAKNNVQIDSADVYISATGDPEDWKGKAFINDEEIKFGGKVSCAVKVPYLKQESE